MTATQLRWIGGGILVFNLWAIGRYNITGVPVLFMTIVFAVFYELVVVRGLTSGTPATAAPEAAQQPVASPSGLDWFIVASKIAQMLEHLITEDAASLAGQHARVVLTQAGDVSMQFDPREPLFVLGRGDVACMFLRQNPASFQTWVDEMQQNVGMPRFQRIAIEEFAKRLTNGLRSQVEL